jgi:hypothetical protein
MILTAEEFINYFPEFEDLDEDDIQIQIDKTVLITNSYRGICHMGRRQLAVALNVAHQVTIQNRLRNGEEGGKKKIKSYNEEIEFNVSSEEAGSGLQSTIYGRELLELLSSELPPSAMY